MQQERGLSDTDYSGLEYLECEESNHGAVPGILPLNLPFNKKKSTTTKRVKNRRKEIRKRETGGLALAMLGPISEGGNH